MSQMLSNSENPVSALLNQALEIDDPEQRQEYLKQVCGENTELLEEVESLLHFASILDEYKEADLSKRYHRDPLRALTGFPAR